MSGPTIYRKGSLIAHEHSPSQEKLNQIVPLNYIMDWISYRINKAGESPADRIMILQSSTGSGKSTVIPPEFYHRFSPPNDKRFIACTQPKVLSTVVMTNSVTPYQTAEFLRKTGFPERRPIILGENIGFQTGSISNRPKTGIIYMSDGSLLRQLMVMEEAMFINRYSLIVVDECHIRSDRTDFLMYMIKNLVNRNYENIKCPFVIITSATFDTVKYADYMLSAVPAPRRYHNIIKVSGHVYKKDIIWPKYDVSNYIQEAADVAARIHKENPNDFLPVDQVIKNNKDLVLSEDLKKNIETTQQFRDILIFVCGSDGKKIIEKLKKLNISDDYFSAHPIITVLLNSSTVSGKSEDYINLTKRYRDIMVSTKSGQKSAVRRIIVATNVAETGITIDSLRYVIETGFQKSSEYNPCYNAELLVTAPVTKGMHIQRVGRAGRLAPGVAYPLYTEATYNKLISEEYPDIIKSNILGHLLNLVVKMCDPQGYGNQHSTWDLLCGQVGKDLKYMEGIRDTKFNIYEYDLMDLPSADAINGAINKLFILGAINSNCTPTPIGLIMNRFGLLSIEAAKIILSGYAWGAPIIDLIVIGCLVSFIKSNDLYSRRGDPYNRKLREGVFNLFGSKNSYLKTQLTLCCDMLMFVVVWSEFQKYSSRHLNDNDVHIVDWCRDHGLNYDVLSEMITYRDDTVEMLSKIGLDPYANFSSSYMMTDSMNIDKWIRVMKQCIFEGFKYNIAVWDTAVRCYTTKMGRLKIPVEREWITPTADIISYNSENPKHILYTNLLIRQKFADNTYDVTVGYVSALSGFVQFDPDFDLIRVEDELVEK